MKSLIILAIVAVVTFQEVATEKVTEKVTDRVTFEISIGNQPIGKIRMGLFGNKAPITVANFIAFASDGYQGKKYEGSHFHRVIKEFMIQGGDVVSGDGRGSISIYGSTFADELPSHNHTTAGILSMANRGRNTNGSQFFITTIPTPWLDGKHVVFGKVLDEESMKVLHEIENTEVNSESRPKKEVTITKSSVESLKKIDQFLVDLQD